MKKLVYIAGLLMLGVLSVRANPSEVSFGVFYSSLSPHGEWIQSDGGVYAWRPVGVAAGWRPYYDGRWCWTDQGWYWASDEPWAWATYHYGRWYNDDFYGWVWVPGYDWAPAWVEWRYGGDYVGWAPLSPYAVFNVSFGIHYRSYWITPHFWWSFVDCRYISSPHVHRYIYRTEYNTRYIGRTRSAGSVRYVGGRIITRGPERGYVEQRGNIRIERAEIRDVTNSPVDKVVREDGRERVEVYRPKIEERAGDDRDIRPDRVSGGDRRLAFDTKNLDVRSRSVDRESGRDMRRAEEYRRSDDNRGQRDVQLRDEQRNSRQGFRQETDRRPAPEVRRGQPPERRNDQPRFDRERRVDVQRDGRRAAPEIRSRRPDGSDRSAMPHPGVQRGGRGGETRSGDDGRRR